ncbi:AzlD domain-containing protein [Actinophytocola sp.]|uniref:AzlD domain-containing protein n=1 Tax=Actinophytocola sp. TaxID=1872138 RepID=UPI002ED2A6E6
MTITAVLVLAAGTYAFRLAGPLLRERLARAHGGEAELPPRLSEVLSTAATVLLVALIATTTLTDAGSFAGIALPAGVLTGGVLAWRKAPFVIVVVAAAVVAAGLRALGVP